MLPRFLSKPFRGRTALLMTCLSIAGVVTLTGASKSRAITKLTLDPTADVVPLFDGIGFGYYGFDDCFISFKVYRAVGNRLFAKS